MDSPQPELAKGGRSRWLMVALMLGALVVVALPTAAQLLGLFAGRPSIHVLEAPLPVITADGRQHGLLPMGTTLEHDTGFSEGFDRYRVYVNVEGPPLPIEEAPARNYVAPLVSFGPSDRPDLPALAASLRAAGVQREDLERLLAHFP